MDNNWKPGDLMAFGHPSRAVVGFRIDDGWTWVDGSTSPSSGVIYSDMRRLVVIDPEDREQVERLLGAYAGWKVTGDVASFPEYIADMQAALREFASPTPPIEEPTNLYAVVRDKDNREWCHVGGQVWRSLTSTGAYVVEKHWHDNSNPLAGNVVEILAGGVTS